MALMRVDEKAEKGWKREECHAGHDECIYEGLPEDSVNGRMGRGRKRNNPQLVLPNPPRRFSG